MALDAFVKIDGIDGESTDDKHQGWIEIQSFGTGHTQTVSRTASSVGGASTERADFHEFQFEKLLDKATPKLALACADGTHINKITVEVCRAGTDKINHVEFRQSEYAAPLRRMNYITEGKMKPNGVLEAAQKNHRLHKTDGHFYLNSFNTSMTNGAIKTIWSVKSIYNFEPFEKKDYYTEIPLGDFKLIIPDGLSEYMTHIGVAKVFNYSAEWQEIWNIG